MDDSEKKKILHWIKCWKQAGPILEQIKNDELRKTSTMEALINISGAYESCRLHFQPRPYSGLVEQQKYFKRLQS